ncbi:MAG: amidohydrolase family protein [Pseudomonadota bacterium]
MTSNHRIDVHHHILPPHYIETVGAHAIAVQGSSGRVPTWALDHALEGMDGAGIQTAITSLSAPGLAQLPAAPAQKLARWCNDFAAGMMQDHPGRFGMFATLPVHDMDTCLQEVAYAYDTLGADGVCLLSNYAGRYLGDESLRPLYEELDRRKAVVFVHPTSPQHMVQISQLSASTLEFPFDTARTAASLVFGGVTRDFPAIRWILSHAGGALPYLCGRVEVLTTNNPTLRERIPDGFEAELAKFYFDTALSANAMAMNALAGLASTGHILFGTDYPFGPKGQMLQAAQGLDAIGWTEEDTDKVRHGNAQLLFPRLA